MQIDADILITWGAVAKKFKKGDFIFYEGDHARFYFQILVGTVKRLIQMLMEKNLPNLNLELVTVLENLLCLSMKHILLRQWPV